MLIAIRATRNADDSPKSEEFIDFILTEYTEIVDTIEIVLIWRIQ